MPGKSSLALKLAASFLLPSMCLFVVFSMFVYRLVSVDLEESLGQRLEAIAGSASLQLRGDYLASLGSGDEEDVRFTSARRKLLDIKAETGVSRLVVFDNASRILVDTGAASIGGKDYQAEIDRLELAELRQSGRALSSLLFEGHDRSFYKRGYAPVFLNRSERTFELILGVDAPADFFDALSELRRQLWLYGLGLAGAVTLVSLWFATRLTRPLQRLATSAQRIGRGELKVAVSERGSDEIGVLAGAMESMRQELNQRNERMQVMLAGIAHEVRNPLGGMTLYAGILSEELADRPDALEHLGRIEREIKYVGDVVDQFLDYARPTHALAESIRVDSLASEVCGLMGSQAAAGGVTLRCETEALLVQGDVNLLKRALVNLVQNAIQASPGEGAVVVVCVKANPKGGRLSVKNSGAGVDAAVSGTLLQPFVTTREKGTGLGLAFVKDIADSHGAELTWVSNEGEGAEFTVTFPERE